MDNLPAIVGEIAPQADTDAALIRMWVDRHGSKHTQRNYERRAEELLRAAGKPIARMRLGDLQAYLGSLADKAPATQANAAAAIKSLFSFALSIGYVRFNIGAAIKAPAVKGTLAERIMTEAEAMRLLALIPPGRDHAILLLLYGGGLRISEACGLRWCDLKERDGAGQATIFGKGGKTRAVLLSANAWKALQAIRGDAKPDHPVFPSRNADKLDPTKPGALDPSRVHAIVKSAAARAGLPPEVSAHWLRHAHASHSLDRGAPIHLVQATLGHASVATTGRYLHARPSDSSARYLGI